MPRKLSTLDPQRLDNQICFAVYSAAHAFNRVYKPLLDRLGLTYPQYLVMLVLWERDDVPLKDIGEKLFLDTARFGPADAGPAKPEPTISGPIATGASPASP